MYIIVGLGFIALTALFIILVRQIDYRLGRHEVEVLFFGRVIRRVPLFEIADVIIGARFPCEWWPSRWSFRGRFLTIRRKNYLLRNFVISPKHPDRLRQNIYFALGWKPDP